MGRKRRKKRERFEEGETAGKWMAAKPEPDSKMVSQATGETALSILL